MSTTPWFAHSVKPARKGVYQRRMGTAVQFAYWDGSRWHVGSAGGARLALKQPFSGYQADGKIHFKWRGLTEPTKINLIKLK